MTPNEHHSWPRIFGVFATGVAAAFLVGKAPAALPALRSELGMTLFQAGLLVSMLSLVAGFGGVFIGALAEYFGQRRTAATGLIIATAAGIGGAMAQGPALLLTSRAIEGIGFFMISVSLPGLIIQLSDSRRRQSAMGLWGAYLPLGAGLILLAGGLIIASTGWRGLWLIISASLAGMLLMLLWAAPAPQGKGEVKARDTGATPTAARGGIISAIATTLATPGAVMLAVTFGCYSGQYLALTSFVPLILVEQEHWPLPAAAAIAAFVMMSNAFGNIAAGMMLDKGVRRAALIVTAAGAMAIGSGLVMTNSLPVEIRLAGALLFSSFGGMIPGALFAGVRQHAPSPSHVSTVNGLMLQAVAIGQFIGPALATYLVTTGNGDWRWSLYFLLPMAAVTALAGLRLGRIEAAASRPA